jgi:hypothetical protein
VHFQALCRPELGKEGWEPLESALKGLLEGELVSLEKYGVFRSYSIPEFPAPAVPSVAAALYL